MGRSWLDRLKGRTDEACLWEVQATFKPGNGPEIYSPQELYHGTFGQVMDRAMQRGGKLMWLNIKRVGTPTVLR